VKNIWSLHDQVATLPFEHRFTVDPEGILPFYADASTWSPYIADYRSKQLLGFLRRLAAKVEPQGTVGVKQPYADWELEKWIPGYTTFVERLETSMQSFTYNAAYPGSFRTSDHNEMAYYPADRTRISTALTRFLDDCHQSICDIQGASVFLEDNTWTSLFLSPLIELLPTAKVIVMLRDPRDVVASMMRQRWTPSSLEDIVTYYQDLVDVYLKQKSLINAESILEIKLENLISASVDTIETMGRFMGLEASEQMLDFDLSAGHVGRYKQEFDATTTQVVNDRLSEYIIKFGYS
jgi:hypothetical protein